MERELLTFFAMSVAVRYPRQLPRFIPFLLHKIETGQEQEILVYKNGDRLTIRDMRSLSPRKWLISRVLDFALRDCTRVSRPYPLVISLMESNHLVRYSGFPASAVDRMINADVNRIVLIPLFKNGHYTLMTLDRGNQIARYFDSSVGCTPPEFPERVFQSLKLAFHEQNLKKHTWHDELVLVQETVRQQGNNFDCALHVLTHAILVNAKINRLTDIRFCYESIFQLRKDLLNRFLEDRSWSDCEVQELRIRDPDYQEPVHNAVDEVSEDEVEIIEEHDPVQPRARAEPGPSRALVQEPAQELPVRAQNQVEFQEWESVHSIKQFKKLFKNNQEMETAMKGRPEILREWVRRSYLPAKEPGRFHFGPSWYRLRVIKFMKKIETRKMRNKKKREKRRGNAKARKCESEDSKLIESNLSCYQKVFCA